MGPSSDILGFRHFMSGEKENLSGFPTVWKTWKMKKAFSRPRKIMELKKKAKITEKSWNLKISIWKNHAALLVQHKTTSFTHSKK